MGSVYRVPRGSRELDAAKSKLDHIIEISRVHLYKPVQVAEILHRVRKIAEPEDLYDVSGYRNASKKWRDEVTMRLVGNVCTSSQRFQDNLFDENAVPPGALHVLAEANKPNGVVETYIYARMRQRLGDIAVAMEYINDTEPSAFSLHELLGFFVERPGLRRSIDKAYEIVVYSLFSVLIDEFRATVTVSVGSRDDVLIRDFADFLSLVLGLEPGMSTSTLAAKIFRAGVANAADRGVDIWANFGPVIQVKHVSLSHELAEGIIEGISADRIVIVCSDEDRRPILLLLKQLGQTGRVQGVVTLSELTRWYGMVMKKHQADKGLGDRVLASLKEEFCAEFPGATEIGSFMAERGYDESLLVGPWMVD